MTIRIVALALVVALVGGAVASADPGTSQPVAVELEDGPAADLATPPDRIVVLVLPVRQLVAPVPPPPAALTPRLHVDSPFRPPRV